MGDVDPKERLKTGVYVATDRLDVGRADGTKERRIQGELVPEAAHWNRAFIDLTNARRLFRLSPEACAAVVREAIAADPEVAVEILRTAREVERQRKAAATAGEKQPQP